MKRFLISFDDGAMAHIPEAELPAVSMETRAVVREAKAAGAWIFGGGMLGQQRHIVATDGSVSKGPYPETKPVFGGFSILEVSSLDKALSWAAKLAASCRCAQEVREILFDPES
jgi:hypothetical protein